MLKISEANIKELEPETMFIAFRSIVGFCLMYHMLGFASRFEDTCPRHVSRATTRDFRFSNFRLIQIIADCVCNIIMFFSSIFSLLLACNYEDPCHLMFNVTFTVCALNTVALFQLQNFKL